MSFSQLTLKTFKWNISKNLTIFFFKDFTFVLSKTSLFINNLLNSGCLIVLLPSKAAKQTVCYIWIEYICDSAHCMLWLRSCICFEAKGIRAAWCMHSTIMTDFALQSKNVSFLNTLCSIFVCLAGYSIGSRCWSIQMAIVPTRIACEEEN